MYTLLYYFAVLIKLGEKTFNMLHDCNDVDFCYSKITQKNCSAENCYTMLLIWTLSNVPAVDDIEQSSD